MNKEIHTRLNQVFDGAGLPVGRDRRKAVSKMFGVSVETARKWEVGESIPDMGKLIEMAGRFKFSLDWLLTGKEVVGHVLSTRQEADTDISNMLDITHLPASARLHLNAFLHSLNDAQHVAPLNKEQAIKIFGTQAEMARAIGISTAAVANWPDHLPPRISDRVVAAAYKRGIRLPSNNQPHEEKPK